MINKWLFLWVLFCWSTQSPALEFLDLEQQRNDQELIITPKFDLQLTQKVIDAINNGIVITFVYQVKTYQSKNWWFDPLIESKLNTFEVRYFSLSNQYQLHNLHKNKHSFIALDQLLNFLGHQSSFVFSADKPADYIETRIFLDKQALPSIMQLPNVFDADWNLNTDWQAVQIDKTKLTTDQP